MKLIEDSPKIRRIKFFISISLIIIFIIMLPFYNESQERPFSPFSIILSIFAMLWTIANIFSNYFIPPFKIIGNINFYKDYIKLKDIEIPIEKITLLRFRYVNYGGQSTSLDGFSITYGDKNVIIIKTDDGTKYEYNLFLKNRSDYIFIQRIFKFYANEKVKVEFYNKSKLIIKT